MTARFRIHGVKQRRHPCTLLIINSPYEFVLTAHCVELKQLFQDLASVGSVEA
jgi:hypothetical protein